MRSPPPSTPTTAPKERGASFDTPRRPSASVRTRSPLPGRPVMAVQAAAHPPARRLGSDGVVRSESLHHRARADFLLAQLRFSAAISSTPSSASPPPCGAGPAGAAVSTKRPAHILQRGQTARSAATSPCRALPGSRPADHAQAMRRLLRSAQRGSRRKFAIPSALRAQQGATAFGVDRREPARRLHDNGFPGAISSDALPPTAQRSLGARAGAASLVSARSMRGGAG